MATRLSLEVAGRTVAVSHPDKVVFPDAGVTKLDLIEYYLAVADGALRGVAGQTDDPQALRQGHLGGGHLPEASTREAARLDRRRRAEVRVGHVGQGGRPDRRRGPGVGRQPGLRRPQPASRPGRRPRTPRRAAGRPRPDARRRVGQIVDVAMVARDVLEDYGLTPWPKTSGSKGFHIYARIRADWPYKQVRLAAETIAREVELRAPDLATSKWWKEERGERVFVDFNQNAKDRTVASAYSVRSRPDARVSTPLHWHEVPDCRPESFTVATVPARYADIGDPWEGMDDAPGALDGLLERAQELGPADKAPKGASKGTGGRVSTMPLIEIARTKTKDEAMAALDTWKSRYPEVADLLEPVDVLVDGMRGPSSIWYRIRINLQHVPEGKRPPQEELLADYSPWEGYSGGQWKR